MLRTQMCVERQRDRPVRDLFGYQQVTPIPTFAAIPMLLMERDAERLRFDPFSAQVFDNRIAAAACEPRAEVDHIQEPMMLGYFRRHVRRLDSLERLHRDGIPLLDLLAPRENRIEPLKLRKAKCRCDIAEPCLHRRTGPRTRRWVLGPPRPQAPQPAGQIPVVGDDHRSLPTYDRAGL